LPSARVSPRSRRPRAARIESSGGGDTAGLPSGAGFVVAMRVLSLTSWTDADCMS
jgi:hypothetical protein